MVEQKLKQQFTTKELMFIGAYMRLRNASAAAEEAGYSVRSARTIGPELMSKPVIKAEIERRKAVLDARYEISADRIARELASMAFGSIDDVISVQDDGGAIVDLSTATPRQLAALSGREDDNGRMRLKHSAADKRQALMDLAKLMRMLPADRVEHSGAIDHHVRPEHKIDIEAMSHDEREQLRTLLLKASGNVTDVEDES
jgi:phage terminase small subunit